VTHISEDHFWQCNEDGMQRNRLSTLSATLIDVVELDETELLETVMNSSGVVDTGVDDSVMVESSMCLCPDDIDKKDQERATRRIVKRPIRFRFDL
jgi:hypothetical protein